MLSTISIRTANQVCIDLRGRNIESEIGRVFTVNSGVSLSIQDSVGGGSITGTGYELNNKYNGGAIYVEKESQLYLYGGMLTNRIAEDRTIYNGGVVCVAGEFYMYGGVIENGVSHWAGGNIYVASSGAMYMYGGKILGGKAQIGQTSCVLIRGKLTLGGDPEIDKVRLWPDTDESTMEDILVVDGKFTGKVCLFVDGAQDGMDIGNLINGGSYAPENLYFSGNSSVPYITGTDMILGSPKAAAIYGEAGFEGYANTMQAAINACQGTSKIISLQRKNGETNTVSQDVYIDLNGFRNVNLLTVGDGATVYLKDSSTDDFTGKCGCIEEITGAVEAMDGYLLATDENGYVSAHAYSLEVNTVVLRPGAAGIYFVGSMNVDENVAAVRKGIVVSLYNANPVADGSDDTCLWTTGDTSCLVTNILSPNKSEAENAVAGSMPIYARAYIELKDGTILYGDTVRVDLRMLVEAIDTQWNNLNNVQKTAIKAMYAAFEENMCIWETPNLKAAA